MASRDNGHKHGNAQSLHQPIARKPAIAADLAIVTGLTTNAHASVKAPSKSPVRINQHASPPAQQLDNLSICRSDTVITGSPSRKSLRR